MGSVKVLIVEDEIIISEDIAIRLLNMGYDVANIAENVDDAVLCLQSVSVDIVLIDIKLTGHKSGIDLANIINDHFKIPFIFLTSLVDKNTVKEAGKTKPASYLLKPFNNNQVSIAIEVALINFYRNEEKEFIEPVELCSEREEFIKMPGALFLKKDTHYEKIEFKDIFWLEADSNYTYINTRFGKFTYSCVLKKIESILPVDEFLRVHRSYVVNIQNVTGFEGNLLFVNKTQIPVSKSFRNNVFKRFQVL